MSGIVQTRLPVWIQGPILALLFGVGTWVSMQFRYPPENVSTIWLPAGILLAAFAINPPRRWLVLAAFVVPVDLFFQQQLHPFSQAALIFGIGWILPLLGAALLRATSKDGIALDRFHGLVGFAVALAVASTVTASLGAAVLDTTNPLADFDRIWRIWWTGDIVGALVTAPLLLAWSTGRRDVVPGGPVERSVLLASAVVVSIWFFSGSTSLAPELTLYVFGPMLLWSAARFGVREITVTGLAMTLIALSVIRNGGGPYAHSTLLMGDRVFSFQLSMIVMLSVAFAVHALLASQRATEEKLAAEREILRAVMDNVPDLIYSKDRDGRYVVVSASALEKFEADLGRAVLDALPPDQADSFSTDDQRILDGHESIITREMTLPHRDGSLHAYVVTKVPQHGPGGEIVGLIGISRDVTVQRNLQEKLHQDRKMEALGRLAGGVAHDFNNLLTVINGYALLALADLRSAPAEVESAIGEVISAAGRAQGLTSQMMAFSRGQLVMPKVIDLAAVINGLDKTFEHLLPPNIQLDKRLGGPLWIQCDPVRLEQVMMNLVINARDAMPDGGVLRIEARVIGERAARHASVSVRDTGCGMPPEVRARCFEPFFSTKINDRGTGLGLSTVYGIVQQAGGEIGIDSIPGSGTTIDMRFPLADAPARTAVMPVVEVAAQQPSGSRTILLVEDDDAVRRLTRRMLEAGGSRVIEASNAESAHAEFFARPHAIDVVVTDLGLPGRNGYELARDLQGIRPELPVLLISGFADQATIGGIDVRCRFEVLDKPFSMDDLADRLRRITA